jgi:DNA-binding CsgD family transcriptional regulator
VVAPTWPLVGRREELSVVREFLERPGCAGVVVAGAPGVGKTRLATEALRAAEAAGAATAWVTATRAAASIPFGALAHLLPEPDASTRTRLALLRRAGRELRERAAGRRLVLAVDDAHLLDEASAALVHQLAATSAASVLVTVRRGAEAPDSIVALWKDGLGGYLELQALGQHDVERLVGALLGGAVDGETLLRLWEATHGNVLFLRELVVDALERNEIVDEGGVWRWRSKLAPSPRLVELVEGRIGKLRKDERRALELLALGEAVGPGVVASLASPDVLETLQRRGLVESERAGRRLHLRLAHPLYGEALRARLPLLRQRTLCGRLADALEATGVRRRDDLPRIASWRLEAGDGARPELLVTAARRARAAFDPALAARLAEAAVDAGGGVGAGHVLALARATEGRFAEAEGLLAELERAARDDTERARVTAARAETLFWGLGREREAAHAARQAQSVVRAPAARDELCAVRAGFAVCAGRPLDALAAVEPILARPRIPPRVGVRSAIAAAAALAATGRARETAEVVDLWSGPALELADELPFAHSRLLVARTVALGLTGRLVQAEAEATIFYRGALADHARDAAAVWALVLGWACRSRGRVRTAVRWLREGAALLRTVDLFGFLPLCLAELAHAASLAGESELAGAALAEAESVRRRPRSLYAPELALAGAWVAAARGELSVARRRAQEAADDAESSGRQPLALAALHDLVRLGEVPAVGARLQDVASACEGPLAPAFAAHAAALAAGDGAALDDAAASLDALGSHLLAAEAAMEAAACHGEAGRAASRAASSARAATYLEGCEGARTPTLALAHRASILTRREREVAALAAAGLASRIIATRLVLSTRTVENHLQRLYSKLGVTGRAELAAVLGAGEPLVPPLLAEVIAARGRAEAAASSIS